MPARITVDENGYVVSIESLPALKTRPMPSAKKSTTKAAPPSKKPKGKKAPRTSTSVQRSLRTTRPLRDARTWTRCPVCGADVLEKNLQKHRRKSHGVVGGVPSSTKKATTSTPKLKKKLESAQTKGSQGKKTKKLLAPSAGGKRDRTGKGLGRSGQSLHQAFEDASYAGRGLGHMSREHGRFGSLPLYDDYSEESGAD